MQPVRTVVNRQLPLKIHEGIYRMIGGLDYVGKGTNFPLLQVDPFILLDVSTLKGKLDMGMPRHPHCGFSVTSIILDGRWSSWDSIRQVNETDREKGSVYWINTGRGLMHEEAPISDGDNALFQLWMNVPDSKRVDPASVQFASPAQIPIVDLNQSVKIRVIAGTFEGSTSPIQTVSPLCILHVIQQPNSNVILPINPEFNVCIANGNLSDGVGSTANFSGTASDTLEILIFGPGDRIEVVTREKGANYVVFSGKPINEPWVKRLIASGGLIARNPEDVEKKVKQFEKEQIKFGQEI